MHWNVEVSTIEKATSRNARCLRANLAINCIPEDIFEMDYTRYDEFLTKRRVLMAQKIRKYYENL